MILLEKISVWGETDAGAFEGAIELSGGLEVVSAPNSYGKSTAAKVMVWCFGLEAILGRQNDPSCLPLALHDEMILDGQIGARVLSSYGSVLLANSDGRSLELSRAIKGGDVEIVEVEEFDAEGLVRRSKLQAVKFTMADESGGLQSFLFEWFGWPREEVATYDGRFAYIYLENLIPLFYIEQEEGWSQLQARQVTRYGQQQIQQVVIEYVLGALDAVRSRAIRQRAIVEANSLRERARGISERVVTLWSRNGWDVKWSPHGSLAEIVSRWSAQSLRGVLLAEANVDLNNEMTTLSATASRLRKSLATGPVDDSNVSAHSAASQRVIELKSQRHDLNQEIRILRSQQQELTDLLESLDYRIDAAKDVLRLKRTGVGRFEEVECPTCHRYIDPESFSLTDQTEDSVAAHIEALGRDRRLIRSNLGAIAARVVGMKAESNRLEADFRAAERALVGITAAVGAVREQVTKAAADLANVERKLDRVSAVASELDEIQALVDGLLAEAREVVDARSSDSDLPRRLRVFEEALGRYLIALGHSAVNEANVAAVKLDEQYVPYLGTRRLQSLGSASDGPRAIAAYTLALADAAIKVNGFHPGFVLLDEPLQQNPDSDHRKLFSDFLTERLSKEVSFQTVVLTFLSSEEIGTLNQANVRVQAPVDERLIARAPSSDDTPSSPTREQEDREGSGSEEEKEASWDDLSGNEEE